MRSKLTLFAAVCVAALALSSSASATTVLQFSQQTNTDFVAAAVSGATTTLTTHGPSPASPLSIPITITQEGNNQNTSISAFETFSPALTSNTASSGSPPTQPGFNGTIIISSLTGGAGANFLTAVVTNGRLDASGAAGGFIAATGSLNGGLPSNVVLTSADPNIVPLLGTTNAVSLSLVNINPVQPGAGFTSFTAQNTGNFSSVITAIPEPASFISAGTALLAGFGCFGWSRRKSSQA